MSKELLKKGSLILASLLVWLTLDLFTKSQAKAWALSPDFAPKYWFKKWMGLSFHTNEGIAFGWPLPYPLLIGISVLLIALILGIGLETLKNSKEHQTTKSLLLGIILGGALGNFWGRLTEGSVVDFLVLRPIPVFNVADIGITGGLLALIALLAYESSKQ